MDYSTSKALQDHNVLDHHMCTDCDQKHGNATHLTQHQVLDHHLCVRCEQKFHNANDLQQV